MYNLGQYLYRQSPLHQRDPRVKIIAVIAVGLVVLHGLLSSLIAVSGLVVLCTIAARIPTNILARSLRPVLPFFIGLFLLYLFTTPGQYLFAWNIIHISLEGISLGLLQVWKFCLLVLVASLFTVTTSPTEITLGLERLIRPINLVGLSSHDAALMVTLALRFVPTLLHEKDAIQDAQLARGAAFNHSNPILKLRSIGNLAAPLALNIFRRCDDLVEALEARGYHNGYHSYLREIALTRVDYLLIILTLIVTTADLTWSLFLAQL